MKIVNNDVLVVHSHLNPTAYIKEVLDNKVSKTVIALNMQVLIPIGSSATIVIPQLICIEDAEEIVFMQASKSMLDLRAMIIPRIFTLGKSPCSITIFNCTNGRFNLLKDQIIAELTSTKNVSENKDEDEIRTRKAKRG